MRLLWALRRRALELRHGNPELDVYLVPRTDLYPFNQPGHDHVLRRVVRLVKAVRPGEQFVDLLLGFLGVLAL